VNAVEEREKGGTFMLRRWTFVWSLIAGLLVSFESVQAQSAKTRLVILSPTSQPGPQGVAAMAAAGNQNAIQTDVTNALQQVAIEVGLRAGSDVGTFVPPRPIAVFALTADTPVPPLPSVTIDGDPTDPAVQARAESVRAKLGDKYDVKYDRVVRVPVIPRQDPAAVARVAAANATIAATEVVSENVLHVDAPFLWNPTSSTPGTKGEGATVAVVDTGVAPHQCFGNRLLPGASFRNGARGTSTSDVAGHGTFVAAIIAGGPFPRNDGRSYVLGVAPAAKILPVKVLGDDGFGNESDIVSGVEFAIRQTGVRIVNMSLGLVNPTQPSAVEGRWRSVAQEAETKNVLMVAAAGNSQLKFGSIAGPPADLATIVSVGATDLNDARLGFSVFVPNAAPPLPALSAPGYPGMPSALNSPSGNEIAESPTGGTSFAAPHVSGAAALVISTTNGAAFTAPQLRQFLATRVRSGTANSGRGAGALLLSAGSPPPPPQESSVVKDLGDRIDFWSKLGFTPPTGDTIR
jgi:subtilisin family serine protease